MATFYVRTDSTAGGDGTEDRTDGATRAYASLDEALDNRWTGTPSTPIEIECSAPTGVADTTPATIADVSSTTSNYLRIYPKAGHRASTQWSTSKYRLSVSATGDTPAIAMNDEFARLEGIQIENSTALASGGKGVMVSRLASGDQRIIGCHIRLTGATGTPNAYAGCIVADGTSVAFRLTLVNNVLVGGYAGIVTYYASASGAVQIAYNNLCIAQTDYGIRTGMGAGTLYIKNNATQGSPTAGYYDSEGMGNWTSATNLSEDATSPQTGLRNLAISFADEGNGDYALASGDTSAKDAGTDLSGDGQYGFTTDINGTTRGATWDIGPHEYVSSGGGSIPVIRHHFVQQGIS